MQINKIKEMQVVVEDLLHQYAHYRDSDTRIIAHIWMRQLGGLENMKSISLYDFSNCGLTIRILLRLTPLQEQGERFKKRM